MTFGWSGLICQDLLDIGQGLGLLAQLLVKGRPQFQDRQARTVDGQGPGQFFGGRLVVRLRDEDLSLGQEQVDVVRDGEVALFQDGQGLRQFLELDQHRGLHLVGQDLLGVGRDRLVEIGQGTVPFLGFRLHQAAGPQHHGVGGQRANGLVEIGQPLLRDCSAA